MVTRAMEDTLDMDMVTGTNYMLIIQIIPF